MDPRVPHRKREPSARAPADGGVWTARDYSKAERAGLPQEGSDYWAWRHLEESWADHRIRWRPRDSDMTEEEEGLDVISTPAGESYEPILKYHVLGTGRASGRAILTAELIIQKLITMTVDSHSGTNARPERRNASSAEAKLCRDTSTVYGASEILPPEAPVFGYIPKWVEVRCPGCTMGRLSRASPGALRARSDGRYRMEDLAKHALEVLEKRWAGMSCEEVRNALTVLAVMGS